MLVSLQTYTYVCAFKREMHVHSIYNYIKINLISVFMLILYSILLNKFLLSNFRKILACNFNLIRKKSAYVVNCPHPCINVYGENVAEMRDGNAEWIHN